MSRNEGGKIAGRASSVSPKTILRQAGAIIVCLNFFRLFLFRRKAIITSPFALSRTLPGVDVLCLWDAAAPRYSVVVGPGFPSTDHGPKVSNLTQTRILGVLVPPLFLLFQIGASFACGDCEFFVDGLPYSGGTGIAAGLEFH